MARPGDYAQGMMDLGATVCTPRTPSCLVCPARAFCAASARGEAERFPVKAPKAERPVRRGDAFVIVRTERGDPHILLRRRKDKGLLGGMMEAPCSEWAADAPLASPPDGNWTEGRTVQHTFTHFHLEMRVLAAHHDEVKPAAEAFGGDWAALANLSAFALPSVMKKAVASGLEALGLERPQQSLAAAPTNTPHRSDAAGGGLLHRRPQQTLSSAGVETLIAQRIPGIALGYEDLNDHIELRHDPVLGLVSGKAEARRSACAVIAGNSTFNRLEAPKTDEDRYRKLSVDEGAMKRLFISSFSRPTQRRPKRIVSISTRRTIPSMAIRKAGSFTAITNVLLSAALYFLRPELLVHETESREHRRLG